MQTPLRRNNNDEGETCPWAVVLYTTKYDTKCLFAPDGGICIIVLHQSTKYSRIVYSISSQFVNVPKIKTNDSNSGKTTTVTQTALGHEKPRAAHARRVATFLMKAHSIEVSTPRLSRLEKKLYSSPVLVW